MSRILLIAAEPYHPWKGASRRILHNLEALTALGHEVDLLTFDAGDLPDIKGVRVFLAPHLFGGRLGVSEKGGGIARFLMFIKGCMLADRKRYDLIHGMGKCGAVASRVSRWAKIPFVVELHSDGLPSRAGASGKCVRASRRLVSVRRALSRASAVICNDMSVISYLAGQNLHSRACVIPDMPSVTEEVAEPALNLARIRFRRGPEQKIITCVGSHSRFNGMDMFFNAVPLILAALEARFVVAGGTPEEIGNMRDRLAAAGVDGAVSFAGRMSPVELAALLAVSDVLVSPRRGGGAVPVKLLDYLYSGTPIAAVDTPANRAILSPANALIMRPEHEALAKGVVKLCLNPEIGVKLAREGRATLRRENRCAEAFKEALRSCYSYASIGCDAG